jgi:hypothetical protein
MLVCHCHSVSSRASLPSRSCALSHPVLEFSIQWGCMRGAFTRGTLSIGYEAPSIARITVAEASGGDSHVLPNAGGVIAFSGINYGVWVSNVSVSVCGQDCPLVAGSLSDTSFECTAPACVHTPQQNTTFMQTARVSPLGGQGLQTRAKRTTGERGQRLTPKPRGATRSSETLGAHCYTIPAKSSCPFTHVYEPRHAQALQKDGQTQQQLQQSRRPIKAKCRVCVTMAHENTTILRVAKQTPREHAAHHSPPRTERHTYIQLSVNRNVRICIGPARRRAHV